ncbi:MAG: hypothetical protein ACOX3S_05980 [Anaerolineae bacterium]|jgi:hypothetical protein
MSVRADSGKRFGPGALILGAVLGLAVGLLAAWVVWPVKWADTDPADLRAEHQQTYLLLVADSYAINGDVPLAQRRLQELTPDGRDLSAVASLAEGMVAERLAQGDVAAAARLSRLIEDTGLPMGAPAQAAAPASEAVRPGRAAPNWVMILFGLGAALVGLAAVVGLLLSRQSRRKQQEAEYPVFDARLEPLEEAPTADRATPREPTAAQRPSLEELLGMSAAELTPRTTPQPAVEDREVAPWEGIDEDEAIIPPTVPSASRAAPGVLREFDVAYRYGDDDFYQSVTIDTAEESFVGQCGMVISDVLGSDEAQQVTAFDVWLFETQGTRTVSKVLMSPWAAGNEGVVARLERKGQAVVAAPNLLMTLETDSLRLTAQVTELAYLHNPEFAEAIFQRLALHLRVEQLAV